MRHPAIAVAVDESVHHIAAGLWIEAICTSPSSSLRTAGYSGRQQCARSHRLSDTSRASSAPLIKRPYRKRRPRASPASLSLGGLLYQRAVSAKRISFCPADTPRSCGVRRPVPVQRMPPRDSSNIVAVKAGSLQLALPSRRTASSSTVELACYRRHPSWSIPPLSKVLGVVADGAIHTC